MRSWIGIEVNAPARHVFALVRDVERWPQLLPHYLRAQVVDRDANGGVVAVFIAIRPLLPVVGLGLPVAWRSRVRADASLLRLHFRHLGGVTAGMNVTWRLEDHGGRCHVTIEHDFGDDDSLVFRLRAYVIDRFFIRSVASRTLATFRALAEATAETEAEPRAETGAEAMAPASMRATDGVSTASTRRNPQPRLGA